MEVPPGRKDNLAEKIKRSAIAFALAMPLAARVEKSASAQAEDPPPLVEYGRILIMNATGAEGGTMGYGGLVYDPQSGKLLLCTIEHVAEGGSPWRGLFDPVVKGDDPVVCLEQTSPQAGVEEFPQIDRRQLNPGDALTVPSPDRDTVGFTVTEIDEEGKVWFVADEPEQWTPGRGDSGTLIGDESGTSVLAVFAGEKIEPNRDDPLHPTIIYYGRTFEEQEASN